MAAVRDHDRAAMGDCIAETTKSKKLTRSAIGELSDKELTELADLMAVYEITDEETDSTTSVVTVKYKTKNDRISLSKSESGWKITDL